MALEWSGALKRGALQVARGGKIGMAGGEVVLVLPRVLVLERLTG